MTMTFEQYRFCVSELQNYADRDAYVSDICLSSVWGDELGGDIPADLVEAVGQIWDASHARIADIAAAAGLSNRKLAERFGIGYRTVEKWSAGERQPRGYILRMMHECLGLYNFTIAAVAAETVAK